MYAEHRQVQPVPALASGAVVTGLALALVLGLRGPEIAERAEALASVAFPLEKPRQPKPTPKRKPPPVVAEAAPEGDPGWRNLRNRATQVVVPPPRIDLDPPPTLTTTLKPNVGDAAQTGASDLPGPGEGAGDYGDGYGGGGLGGEGRGRGAGRPVQMPRAIRDKLRAADVPESVWPSERGNLAIEVMYQINADGSVSDCRAVESSGDRRADAFVCRLIEQRFRFHPARDRSGRPVAMPSIQYHEFEYRGG